MPSSRHYLEIIRTIKFIMNFMYLLMKVYNKGIYQRYITKVYNTRGIVICEVCSTHQKVEKCLQNFTQKKKLKERGHLKEL
jgi:hypothetical protein